MQTLHFLKAKSFMTKILAGIFSILFSVAAVAQDKTVDVNIGTKGGGSFFSSPWVWVVGGAVFILLLVALMRGGGRKDA